jgi:hypothetical protein
MENQHKWPPGTEESGRHASCAFSLLRISPNRGCGLGGVRMCSHLDSVMLYKDPQPHLVNRGAQER